MGFYDARSWGALAAITGGRMRTSSCRVKKLRQSSSSLSGMLLMSMSLASHRCSQERHATEAKMMGKAHWTKRSKETGRFMDVKKGKKKFKGVRKEKKAA